MDAKVKNIVGAVIRGKYIEDNLMPFGGRSEGVEFLSPDPHMLIRELPLGNPDKLSDLYELSFEDILDYLEALGEHLVLEKNPYLQHSLEASCNTASYQTLPLLKSAYRSMQPLFKREYVRQIAEQRLGVDYLEGWVDKKLLDGRTISIRAFGAKALHIIAGNSPTVAAISIIRNAITRSDMIIKSPSNDPFTALAIVRTMVEMAPDHPITRHVSVAYWKGGDEFVESQLYKPHVIEKLLAWGGFASVKHVTKYIQPGIDLITLEPKRSRSVIGPEAFKDDATRFDVAKKLAVDFASFNGEGCVCSRVAYVLSGTDDAGIERLNRFGQDVYKALLSLPEFVTGKPKTFDAELRTNIKNARLNDDWYNVIGGEDDEGAVIVSQTSEDVDFSNTLSCRVVNLVPIDKPEEAFQGINSYTQTVGIYPDSLKKQIRDKLPLYGAQRLTTLGYAPAPTIAGPQDGIEPLRRMCKWIFEEECNDVPPFWEDGIQF